MNLTRRLRRETCPTCQQVVVPPTPSAVILVRVGMACFAALSGVVEYRRAVRRELEARQLEEQVNTSPDVPLDEHLEQNRAAATILTSRRFVVSGAPHDVNLAIDEKALVQQVVDYVLGWTGNRNTTVEWELRDEDGTRYDPHAPATDLLPDEPPGPPLFLNPVAGFAANDWPPSHPSLVDMRHDGDAAD